MAAFPAFFEFSARPLLVIGGGEAAARKVRLLLQAEAAVTVLAEELNDELAGLLRAGLIQQLTPPASAGKIQGFRFVVVAVESGDAGALAHMARGAGAFVNVVDQPGLSDFTMPAIVRRGDIVVGIGSGGTAPLLASRIRAEIEALLPPRLGELARLAGSFRGQVARLLPDADARRRFWQRLLDGPVAAQSLAGDEAGAREGILRLLNRPQEAAQGVVYLVGAGPGDPDLLTLAAQRALARADVIFHDDLVAPAILDRARRDATRISVGKRHGTTRISQDDINRLLLQAAQDGKLVVRLKSGDPFVFGRGGEEAEYLGGHGIAVVAVPGITAALGCAAAAGISLTHREAASALTLVTGHLQDGGADAGHWTARLGGGETVVVYMGLRQAPEITANLLSRGTRPDLPVAIIENGTRPDQQVSAGMLRSLPDLARRHGDGPALLVLGAVAAHARITLPAPGRQMTA